MLEQLWFRIIVCLFCLLLAFLVGCSKKDITPIEKGKQVILEVDKRDKEDKVNDSCEGESGVCPPPEGYDGSD